MRKTGVFLLCFSLLALSACTQFRSPREKATYYYQHGYYKQAYPTFFNLARQQDPVAMYTVGYMRYYGMGVAKDKDVARAYIQRAANMGYQPASDALKMIVEDHPNMRVERGGRSKPIVYRPQIHGVPAIQKIKWIRERHPYHFTLIADVGKQNHTLAKSLVQQLKLDVAAYSEVDGHKVKRHLSIGDFADEASAKKARAQLPKALRAKTKLAYFRRVQSVMLPD